MARVVWTTPALKDAEAIRDYIARDSPRYARLVTERIVAATARLADFPQSGRMVPELRQPALREVIVGRYRVVYRMVAEEVQVAAVVHGARRFPTGDFEAPP